MLCAHLFFFFSSRRRHTRCGRDWSSDVCSSDLVNNAGSQCFRRETTKHHRVDGTDTGTGQHGNGSFNNHRHVDGDDITLLDALIFQYVGKLTGFFVQFAVGNVAGNRGIIAFENNGGLVCAVFQVTVQAVGRGVQHAVFKPLDGQVVVVVGAVLDLAVGLDPVQALAVLAPEGVRVFYRLAIHGFVL